MRRRYLIAIVAGLAVLPLAALAQQAVPSIAPQGHEEMWALPSAPVPMLAYLIRPIGGGPFPLVVMNHGVSLDATGRSYFPVIEFRDAALWFARQGYVVVAPVRPGYGATAIEIPERGLFGLFFSGVGKCSDAEFREAGLAVASIDKWVIDYMSTQSFIKRNEVIIVGQSGGGWGSIALGSQNPESVRAIIVSGRRRKCRISSVIRFWRGRPFFDRLGRGRSTLGASCQRIPGQTLMKGLGSWTL